MAGGRAQFLRRRAWMEQVTARLIALGGISVVGAVLLIFFYLAYVVAPLFLGASLEPVATYPAPGSAAQTTAQVTLDEFGATGLRLTTAGTGTMFTLADGNNIGTLQVPLPAGVQVTSSAVDGTRRNLLALGLSDGRVIVALQTYRVSYPNDQRTITPVLEYPLGETPWVLDTQGQALQQLALHLSEHRAGLVAQTPDGRLIYTQLEKSQSLLDDGTWQPVAGGVLAAQPALSHLHVTPELNALYASVPGGQLQVYRLESGTPVLAQKVPVGANITAMALLSGGVSLLVGDEAGGVSQYFPVRDAQNQKPLQLIRHLAVAQAPITALVSEERRKGFVAGTAQGEVILLYATGGAVLTQRSLGQPIQRLFISPRADRLVVQTPDAQLHVWHVHNEHPEINWATLWGKVWYEGYTEPTYTWQSSAANNDFEPKFSLVPLTFGTLKAAFYALLIAIPLAIMGAIFTAHFMVPRMRQVVKPTIEVMEALPTVVLGFIAGLWLAPFVEHNLAGIFAILLLFPLAFLFSAWLWFGLPLAWRNRLEGWEAALLIPVVLLTGWVALSLGSGLEWWLFGGDIKLWMRESLGIGYDQRNALVVGIAMGFAVIPPIFSIAEDAIFSVPKHLVQGSLALGATQWQTVTRVVLLTASPGIFSAVMMGLGRAVGETMIVLMATGNTPVIDPSIFQGLRALSANIAVELPESEVLSTHYRVLFLAAFVLFILTFVFNTLAELVRQRLRKRYSSL